MLLKTLFISCGPLCKDTQEKFWTKNDNNFKQLLFFNIMNTLSYEND